MPWKNEGEGGFDLRRAPQFAQEDRAWAAASNAPASTGGGALAAWCREFLLFVWHRGGHYSNVNRASRPDRLGRNGVMEIKGS
jgi:hypothetical protein